MHLPPEYFVALAINAIIISFCYYVFVKTVSRLIPAMAREIAQRYEERYGNQDH